MWTSIRSLTMAAMLLAGAIPALADPSGNYTIAGTNPDGSTYDASVLVAKVGDTFTLTYTLQDGTKLQGTGIGDDDVMAIGYLQDGESGVALMYREGGKWMGVWSYIGAKTLGTEEWQPQ
jgi:hypothetical protein